MSQISVYSGEDIISSRKAFLEHLERLKNEDFEIYRVAGKDITEESLALLSSPTSLFGQKRVLVIENLLAGTKSKEKNKIIQIVSLLNCALVLWENKNFTKGDQLKYPNFVFKNFKLPQVLFKFLDSLSPKKINDNLRLFREAIESTDPNFLFLMLIRQIRLLILASDKNDLLKLAPWQKAKLQKQAQFFSLDELKQINRRLLQIDFEQKTSRTPFLIEKQLEILLTEI